MYETIKFEVNNQIAKITLNRPDKLNAFSLQMHEELLNAVKQVKKNPEVRCLVLTGEGRAFCSGQDLTGVAEGTDYGDLLRKTYNPLIMELTQLEFPVIAAVNGVAAGAGFSLALACDFRLASEKASFIQAFIHVGLVPDSGSFYFLPRLVGYAKALELSVLGEKVSAMDAYRLGLVTKIISAENWDQEVMEYAEKLASMPTKTIGLIKKYMQQSFAADLHTMLENEAYAQRMAGMTEDHIEGVMAFSQKRKPEFKGK